MRLVKFVCMTLQRTLILGACIMREWVCCALFICICLYIPDPNSQLPNFPASQLPHICSLISCSFCSSSLSSLWSVSYLHGVVIASATKWKFVAALLMASWPRPREPTPLRPPSPLQSSLLGRPCVRPLLLL